MEAIKKPSLFFCIILCCFFSVHKNFGQQPIDSLRYYYKITINPKANNDLLKAYAFFKEYRKKSLRDENSMSAIYALRTIAIIQYKIGVLNDSENSAVEALKILDDYKNHDSIKREPRLGLNNHLGKVCRELKRYNRALKYYESARIYAKELKDFVTLDNNVGNTYLKQEKYDSAINYFRKAYNESLKINDTINAARAQSNIGVAQFNINDSTALFNLESALELRKKKNYSDGIFTSYLHLSNYYKHINDENNAMFYARKAKKVADTTKSAKLNFNALSAIIDLKTDKDIIEYKKLNDSLSTSQRLSKNNEASYNYDLGKLEELASENLLNSENERKQKETLLFLIALLLPTIVYAYFIMKSKHKKDKLQQVYNTETRISKKVHDELANDMSDVMNFVENNIDASVNRKVVLLNNLEDIYIRTRDISTETGSIDLVDFSKSLKHLLMQHNREGTKVITNNINAINWQKVPNHKKMVIYRSLQELMVNMKKHSQAKFVSLAFKEIQHKKEIRYVDDGIGFTIEEANVNGLQNVESRIKGIGGNFNFITSKGHGFKAILKFNS